MDTMTVEMEAQEAFTKWMQVAKEKFNYPFPIRMCVLPADDFKRRGANKCTAGLACYHDWTVRLNQHFLLTEDKEMMLNQTIPHEIAHFVTRWLYPRAKQAHGPEWRSVMRRFGIEVSRCHNYNTEALLVHKRMYVYTCLCGEFYELTCIRHKRQQRNPRGHYRCKTCKKTLTFLHTKA